MRLVRISAPRGKGADVARLAFEQGIEDVALQEAELRKPGKAPEPRDAVDVKVSTRQGKALVDASSRRRFSIGAPAR